MRVRRASCIDIPGYRLHKMGLNILKQKNDFIKKSTLDGLRIWSRVIDNNSNDEFV